MSRTVTQQQQRTTPKVVNPLNKIADPSLNLPFTLTSLRDAIPPHCFDRNLGVSLYYLCRDFVFVALVYALYPYVCQYGDAFGVSKFLWWNLAGFTGWCLFVCGHDAGQRRTHGSGADKRHAQRHDSS